MNEQVKQVREYFQENYPHIHIEDVNDWEIETYMNQRYVKDLSFERVMDLFSDYLLSNGGEVDE